MAEKSRPCTDEASKYPGASTKSLPVGKRFLALAAVRHEKGSPGTSAQEKTPSDVKGQMNSSQAPGDRLQLKEHENVIKSVAHVRQACSDLGDEGGRKPLEHEI